MISEKKKLILIPGNNLTCIDKSTLTQEKMSFISIPGKKRSKSSTIKIHFWEYRHSHVTAAVVLLTFEAIKYSRDPKL